MSKDTFIRGAMILTIAGIIVKIIGAVNRILLSRLLGGEGIGLYQMAYFIGGLAGGDLDHGGGKKRDPRLHRRATSI